MNRLVPRSSRKASAKLIAKIAVIKKAAKPRIMFIFGDFANPVGTEPFIRCARTEESVKILANFNIKLMFKVVASFSEGLNNVFDVVCAC